MFQGGLYARRAKSPDVARPRTLANHTMPLFAVADFCLIPMGTPTTSVGTYIAECQRVLEKMKGEGIKYEVRECAKVISQTGESG